MGFPIAPDQQKRSRRASAVAHGVAVVGGCGYVPVAPGTAGSVAGVVLFVAVVGLLEATGVRGGLALGIHVAIAGCLCAVGVWAAGRVEERFGRHDDGRVVIDEVVGQWVALLPLVVPAVPASPYADRSGFFSAVVTAFVLFRVFDVWKPGVIRWVERRLDGGWGVMADDLVAGVHAALVLSFALLGQARLASASSFSERPTASDWLTASEWLTASVPLPPMGQGVLSVPEPVGLGGAMLPMGLGLDVCRGAIA